MSKGTRRTRSGKPLQKSGSNTSLYSIDTLDSDSSEDSEIEIFLPRKKRRLDDGMYEPVRTSNRSKNDKFYSLEKKIREEIEKREITMDQVFKLGLSMDEYENEYVWFQKHIDIRDNMEEDTEEKFTMTNMIYDRYLVLSDPNWRELEKLKREADTEVPIIQKILNSTHSNETKLLLCKKYELTCKGKKNSDSDEYVKIIDWIETILAIPTQCGNNITDIKNMKDKDKIINNILQKLEDFLTEKIYGLNKVKIRIMQAMISRISDPSGASGKIMVLTGPPGVGKTSVAAAIAEAMDMPFDHIPLGSIQDATMLTGDSRTYVGSGPGLFAKILIKAKRKDVLILLDEIDKITNKKDSNITNVLLHALDSSQNNRCKDNYAPEVPLDLSKCLFLCTANDVNKIDPILLDRITIIDLPGYTVGDKANILETYLVPKFKRELNFKGNEISISKKCLEYLVSQKTEAQPGMRDAETKLRDLFEILKLSKHNKNIASEFSLTKLKFPLKVTEKHIDLVLDHKIE
jgi:ATP-dependent Lon protease